MHTPAHLADEVAAAAAGAAATAGSLLFRDDAIDFPLNVSIVRSYADADKPGLPQDDGGQAQVGVGGG